MTYRVTFDYRTTMPRTWKDSKPWRLIACHWTAGAPGYSGAIGTLTYLVNNAATRNASYHELWGYDEGADDFRVIRIVPASHCAHSLNPAQPPLDPDAWVREALGAYWYDPNQGVYAVAIAGGATECARYAANPKFIGHAIRRINEIRAELPGIVGLAEHFRFQPSNKTDWGRELTPKLGGHRFTTTIPDTATPEDDMYEWVPSIQHQQPKPVIVKAGAVPLKNPDGTEHSTGYKFPKDTELECIGSLVSPQLWVCRRPGGAGLFLIRAADVASWPRVPDQSADLAAARAAYSALWDDAHRWVNDDGARAAGRLAHLDKVK